jgi:hypothetical protein
VPSPRNQNPENRRFDWPAIFRILFVQVLVLLALMTAFVRYVNWSSDQAWAEFSRTVTVPAMEEKSKPPSATPLRTMPCARRV